MANPNPTPGNTRGISPNMMVAYMNKMAGIPVKETAIALGLSESAIQCYNTETSAIVKGNIATIEQARNWQLLLLPIATKRLTQRILKNDALLSKYFEGIGVWNKNIDINVKIIDLTTDELLGIISEESANNPKIKALQDHIEADYTVLEDGNEPNNDRPNPDNRHSHSSHSRDCNQSNNQAAQGQGSLVDKPLDSSSGPLKGVSQDSQGSAFQPSDVPCIPKENIGLSLDSKNKIEKPNTTTFHRIMLDAGKYEDEMDHLDVHGPEDSLSSKKIQEEVESTVGHSTRAGDVLGISPKNIREESDTTIEFSSKESLSASKIHVDESGKRWLLTELPPELSRETLEDQDEGQDSREDRQDAGNHNDDTIRLRAGVECSEGYESLDKKPIPPGTVIQFHKWDSKPPFEDKYVGEKIPFPGTTVGPDTQSREIVGYTPSNKATVDTQSNTQSVPDGTGGKDGDSSDRFTGMESIRSTPTELPCQQGEQTDRPSQEAYEQGGSPVSELEKPKRRRGRPARRSYKWSKHGKKNEFNRRK